MTTQTEQIAKYLDSGHALTALEAANRFGCMRLAARIDELRRAGRAIEVQRVRLYSGKTVAEYRIGRAA